MRSILAATDFSACSRTAVQLAAALARRQHAALVLVHAVESPPLDLPSVPIGATAWEAELLAAAELELARQASEIRQSGIAVETRAHLGSASRLILEVAEQVAADLIVVGTHGRKGAAHLFLGSVAEHVARTSTSPVLVVREGTLATARWEGREPIRLAVGVDRSAASETALAWAGRFAKPQERDLLVARIYSPRDEAARYGLDEPWGELPRDADLLPLLERELRREAGALVGQVPSRLRFFAAGHDAADLLVRDAFVQGTDALVVGVPRHRSGPAALSAGAILRRSPLPVFCIPEAAAPTPRILPQVRSVLIATDLSDAAREIVPTAYGLLRPAGGRVEIFTVHDVGPDAIAESPLALPLSDDERATVEAQLRVLIPSEAEPLGITTNVSVIDARHAPEAILAAAERLDVDLIVLGSHGRSGLGRVLLGSVAEEVARRSPRPVLIVRSQPHGARR